MKKLILCLLFLLGCCGRFASEAKLLPEPPLPTPPIEPFMMRQLSDDPQCKQWVDSVMDRLSLKERIGQLFIYTIAPQANKANRALLRKVIEEYKVGGLLFSGGLMANQAALTNEAQRMAHVPLMITFDGEWGLAMRLRGTPLFPRNRVLGCIQNDSLLYEYGHEMARQCRELGVQVNFAPVADVNINPQNPVINTRSFGESPVNVANKVIAYAQGLEDGGVLSVCKHFPGHGDTDVDSHNALPTLPFTRERLDSVELYPFKKAIRAGLDGIMVGHLQVPVFDEHSGLPSSLSRNIVHDLLERELKFKGLIFTDALAMKGVSEKETICLRALKAGNDLLLVPRRIKKEMEDILAAVKRGELTEIAIEEKCRKVLTYKYALGLNRKPLIRLSGLETRINTAYTRDLINRLNLAAIIVLGNQEKVLPLDTDLKEVAVLNVGDAKEIQPFLKQLSQYTHPVIFQLDKELQEAAGTATAAISARTTEARVVGTTATTAEIARSAGTAATACKQLRDTLAQYKRILVCVTENRLASYQSFFAEFAPEVPVVYLMFIPGKQVLQIHRGVAAASAVVLAHSSDKEVQQQVAKILYADATADGRLSASIGGLFATGDGQIVSQEMPRRFIPEEHGMDSRLLARIDTIAQEGIRQGAYPGCQIAIWKDGKEMYNKAFGTHTPTGKPVQATDVYDIASLTKTTATLLAVMKLYDKGIINLTDRVSAYLPFLQSTDKRDITVRELLLHQSGLPSTLLFYQDAIDKGSYKGALFKGKPDKQHTARIGNQTWANPNFRFRKGLTSKVPTAECTLQISDSLWLNQSFKQEFLQKIADTPLKDKGYRYSCVGFILLQQLVESRVGMSMDAFLQQEFYAPMGLQRTGYLPLRAVTAGGEKGSVSLRKATAGGKERSLPSYTVAAAGHRYSVPKLEIVPSSIDPFLRKTTLQGFVHDESAAFLGGISGNAGLFSTATELARIYQMLLNGGELDGKRYLSKETCRLFTTTVASTSRRGLGFDKPDTRHANSSPCVPSAPATVYGHTGFTGTCAWVDPTNGLVYVFLSNRIYPDVWNTKLQKLEIRERIQEAMYGARMKDK